MGGVPALDQQVAALQQELQALRIEVSDLRTASEGCTSDTTALLQRVGELDTRATQAESDRLAMLRHLCAQLQASAGAGRLGALDDLAIVDSLFSPLELDEACAPVAPRTQVVMPASLYADAHRAQVLLAAAADALSAGDASLAGYDDGLAAFARASGSALALLDAVDAAIATTASRVPPAGLLALREAAEELLLSHDEAASLWDDALAMVSSDTWTPEQAGGLALVLKGRVHRDVKATVKIEVVAVAR